MRKQLDPRIATLIRNNVALNHRSFFILVGDHGRDQVVNLHYLLSQSRTTSRPSVLWCYKKDLGFTTHRKKREAKIKKDIKRGVREKGDAMDPFELFVSVTDIRYCYYKDTPKILGRTFGMLILQDFEAITPNLLARTIETVEGGGVVVLLLRTMTSLRQLYSVAMDVHSKYRSSFDPSDPVARFNERFLLSLSSSSDCLALDDELNVLPISKGKDIRPFDENDGAESSKSELKRQTAKQEELQNLRDELGQTRIVTDVIKHAKTLDQARAVLTILDILASSNLSTTVTLTAARGRGKSAALGLCIAAAIAHGYSNIFVTSPSPENLRTLFEFVFKGLEALDYEEVADWDLQRGTGEWKDVILRVNVFRGHRQTIQYISPSDAHVLGQAELLVIDEAAAIPLSMVRKLMGPYLVFLSSTINGYEGTGRSLSLKLIQQLRDSAGGKGNKSIENGGMEESNASSNDHKSRLITARQLKEVSLREPIRYSSGDKIESWLHELLCLDASLTPLSAKGASPHPSTCQLFMINRDALFSYHPASEAFLQRIMALYVSSHYKNSPNDLQLMSDAPGHRIFVLLAPVQGSSLPEPLCVLQVALEGNIGRQSVLNSLHRGQREAGDLIPWTMSQQYQDAEFATLSGARIVRIAVHPHHAREGYGTRALECLRKFYAGELFDADAAAALQSQKGSESFDSFRKNVSGEVKLRDATRMPALLQRLTELEPDRLDWLGVSYGLTPSLFKFWKQSGYVPLYVRQSPNDVTGEYGMVQLRSVESDSKPPSWLCAFSQDFERRFLSLLGFKFRTFTSISALSILQGAASAARHASSSEEVEEVSQIEIGKGPIGVLELRSLLSPWDMKRLEAYGNNLIEYTVILDLLPTLASLYFTHRLRVPDDDSLAEDADVPASESGEITLSGLQSAMLLALGLQRKEPSEVASELDIAPVQALALFGKAVRRIVASLRRVEKQKIARSMANEIGQRAQKEWKPLQQSLSEDLQSEGSKIIQNEQEKQRSETQRALLDSMDLSKYAIANDGERDWTEAERQAQNLQPEDITSGRSTIVSVKGPANVKATEEKRKPSTPNSGKKKRKMN
ncbi:hypothetical protein L7F22_053900 [Adiantum nelumboides]|nr:hypothetical protein [Adiantum nelumboides]